MKYMMLFADKFEDVEAIATLDVLVRGNDIVDAISMMKRKEVLTKTNHYFSCDKLLEEIDPSTYDALIIPGGPASFTILANMKEVDELIKYFMDNNKLVASICAAPFLVGRLGYFKNKQYTVYPGFEKEVVGGSYKRELGVVRDDNIITAKSMYYSIEFALEIHKYFHGEQSSKKLKASLQGEDN